MRIKLKIHLFIIISFIAHCKAFSQSIEQTYKIANEQYKLNNYEQSINLYERILFFDTLQKYNDVCLKIANSQFNLKNFNKASEYYDYAYNLEKNDSIKIEIIFKKIISLIHLKNFQYSLIELYEIPDSINNYFEQKRNFYFGIVYFWIENYAESEKYLCKYADSTNKKNISDLRQEFIKVKKIEKINPQKAKILSMLLPGLGQFYSGDIKNGINSLIINSLFAFLFINTATHFTVLEAYLVIFPWLERYYTGGYKLAEINTTKIINQKKSTIFINILDILSK